MNYLRNVHAQCESINEDMTVRAFHVQIYNPILIKFGTGDLKIFLCQFCFQ
jgi:hypothetical protein